MGDIAFPVSLRILFADELIADGGIPLGPVVAAGEEHGLDGVVISVVVMALSEHIRARVGGVLGGDVVQAAGDVVTFKNTGIIQRGNTGGGSGEAASRAARCWIAATDS